MVESKALRLTEQRLGAELSEYIVWAVGIDGTLHPIDDEK